MLDVQATLDWLLLIYSHICCDLLCLHSFLCTLATTQNSKRVFVAEISRFLQVICQRMTGSFGALLTGNGCIIHTTSRNRAAQKCKCRTINHGCISKRHGTILQGSLAWQALPGFYDTATGAGAAGAFLVAFLVVFLAAAQHTDRVIHAQL